MKGCYYIINLTPVASDKDWVRFFGSGAKYTSSSLSSAAVWTHEAVAEVLPNLDDGTLLVPCGFVQSLKKRMHDDEVEEFGVVSSTENLALLHQAALAAHLETLRVLRQLRDEILVLQDPEIYDPTSPLRSSMIEADLVLDGQSKGLGQCEGCPDYSGGMEL